MLPRAQAREAPPKPACVPVDSVIAEVFGRASGWDGRMDIQEARAADGALGRIAEAGHPACAWPRAQPTACFVSALPSSVSHKLDVRAFGVFVRCRVVTPACARRLCR